jgi:arylsulfatase A-like enzyme
MVREKDAMQTDTTLRTCAALLAALVGTQAHAQEPDGAPEPDARPNIVVIIGDDFGVDVTSDLYPGLIDELAEKYGPSGHDHPDHRSIVGSHASTPRLDDLARDGMVFTNVWAQPFCSPTRASILTGLFASKAHVLTYADPLAQSHTSFVQLLKSQAGYSTALFGKWHLAGLPGNPTDYPGMKPKEAGFDLFKGNMHAAIRTYWNYDYHVQNADTPAHEWQSGAPPARSLPGIAATTFAPVVKVSDAIDWIAAQEESNPDKPWFVWLAYNLSHATAQQRPSAMAVPNADTLDAKSYDEMQACGGEFGSSNVGACSGEALMRAMTNALDTVTGKLLDAIDTLDPNTYVIFIGDNGTPMYGRPNLDFIDNMYITRSGRGKGTAYESGVRVPMVIKGPGIEADSVSDDYLHAADLFSTALALAGLTPPESVSNSEGTGTVPVDGVSLTPILFDEASAVRDPNEGYLLTETTNLMTGGTRHAGARNATYKVVCTAGAYAPSCEFYNLRDDPLEEYPLDVPASCRRYDNGTWTAEDAEWHYCRLTRIVASESLLAAQ